MKSNDKVDGIVGAIGCVMVLVSAATSIFMLWLAYKLVVWLTAQEL